MIFSVMMLILSGYSFLYPTPVLLFCYSYVSSQSAGVDRLKKGKKDEGGSKFQ